MPNILMVLSLLTICAHSSFGQTGNEGNSIMAIFAHSDDERTVSPVLAKYAKEGVDVYLVLATDGSKGVEEHVAIPAGDSLAKVRAGEALCTTEALGINPPILLNYPDGELVSWDNIFSLDDKIDSLFNEYQPTVVITWGADGGYGHPDHRMVSNIVTEVFQRNESENIKQLLYFGVPKSVLDASPELKTDKAKWYRETFKTTQEEFLTYRIPIDDEDLKLSRAALGCCKSQFTTDVMDDISTLLGREYVYFRPWNGSPAIKHDIFE